MMKCELHNENAILCESHIIPKFVYKWMKKTGSGRLRQALRINIPLQDGIKKDMLCKDCEGKFAKLEKWFAEKVFTPYLKDKSILITNQAELQYFIISILWRVLKYFKDDGNEGYGYNFIDELNQAEIEWRNFLLNDIPLNKFKNHHFILIDSDYWISMKSDLYFSRTVDIEIAESDVACFVYAKFSRFILIGEIIGFEENSFEKTNIRTETQFKATNQVINENGIIDFFRNRVEHMIDFDDLSDDQKMKNNAFYKNKLKDLMEREYLKIIRKYK